MTIKVAINGYGRIGRNVLRAHYEGGKKHDLEIVAINDLGSPETNAHLTRYDTVHGPFPGKVEVDGDSLVVSTGKSGDRIRVLAQRNPAELPWSALGVDVVLECTGLFTSKERASAHLKGGAKKVIISAPGGKDVDATVVYGVNHQTLKASHTVISNASCTTNCLVPLVKPLHDRIGVVNGLIGAAVVAVWFFLLDLASGAPLRTPAALGSALLLGAAGPGEIVATFGLVAAYTVVHVTAFVIAGIVFVALAEEVERVPAMALLVLLTAILLEGLVLATIGVAAQWVLGTVGWWSVAVANVLAVLAMGWQVWRTHPMLPRRLLEHPQLRV